MKCPNCGQSLSPPLFSSNAVVVGSFRCGACGGSVPAGNLRRLRAKYILANGLLVIVVTVLLIVVER
jgi:hypothetical protein